MHMSRSDTGLYQTVCRFQLRRKAAEESLLLGTISMLFIKDTGRAVAPSMVAVLTAGDIIHT